jgi:hypothetical protein
MKTTDGHALYAEGDGRNGASRRRAYRLEERAIGLFLLGVVLFNPLMMSVFDRGPEVELMGVPLLFIYIFCAWTLLVVLLICTVEARVFSEEPSAEDEPKSVEQPDEMR